MRKTLTVTGLALASALFLPANPAFADQTCKGDDVLTPVIGPGPQMDKDRDGDGFICVASGYRGKDGGNYWTRYYDDL